MPKQLTSSTLEELTKTTVMDSMSDIVLGRTEVEKKEWCVKRLTELLEVFDNYIPVVGLFLDNPIADNIQKHGVELLVDWAWEKFVVEEDAQEKTTTQ